jgi:hypothetical protein
MSPRIRKLRSIRRQTRAGSTLKVIYSLRAGLACKPRDGSHLLDCHQWFRYDVNISLTFGGRFPPFQYVRRIAYFLSNRAVRSTDAPIVGRLQGNIHKLIPRSVGSMC